MRKTLGLALGSGGARGVCHVGFLQALEEEGVRPDFIAGCSMGSVVGACYCAGMTPAKIKEAVLGLKMKDIVELNINPIRARALSKTTRIRKLLESYIGDISFEDLKIPFRCVAVDLIGGKVVTLSSGSVLDAVIASSTIPSVFTPTEKDGMLLVDGGVLERVPAETVKEMGAKVVIAVDALGDLQYTGQPENLISLILRMFDLQDANNTARMRTERDYIDLWVEPRMGSMSQYIVKDLDVAYERGYEAGREKMEEILKLVKPIFSPRKKRKD